MIPRIAPLPDAVHSETEGSQALSVLICDISIRLVIGSISSCFIFIENKITTLIPFFVV